MRFTRINRNYYGYFFIAPFILGFLAFGLYPVYNTLALSFTDYTLMSRSGSFIGLRNFEVLFADDLFVKAIKNTWLIWMLNFIPQMGAACCYPPGSRTSA
jgi:cellobiose transport system permease protein